MKLNHKCPVCNFDDGKKLGHLKYTLFDDNPLNSEYDVISCLKCGFVSCNTQSTQNDYDNFYKNQFYSSVYMKRNIDKNEIEYVDKIIYGILPYFRHVNINIYDIGCGTGLLLRKLKNYGYKNTHGVDLSSLCVNTLKNEGIDAEVGSVLKIPFNKKADIIVLSHVLEHIIDLKSALQSIRSRLNVNGFIYVEVPNALNYDSFKNASAMRYFYFQHLIHFDKFHLCNLFKNNGFIEMDSGHCLRREGDLTMPCAWGIFKKGVNDSIITNQSFELSSKIKSMLENSSLDNNNILKDLIKNKNDIYIWGIGTHMNIMLSMSYLKDCNIKYYIDADKRNQEKTINGNKIHDINFLNNATENDTVIIGAPTHSKEMYDYLINTIKFKGKIIKCGFGNIERLN